MHEAAMDRTDAQALRAVVERHFRVYEAREERMQGMVLAHRFFLMFPESEFDARYEAVRADLKAVDPELLVFMRREGGEDILYVTERPPATPAGGRVHVVLLLLTVLTTSLAGAMYWHGYANAGDAWAWSVFWDPVNLGWGALTFALPLMTILGVHESAHFIAARRHGLRATLPYFIPVPPVLLPIGTLGALIRMKDPLPDRKALFDLGASGPIAGFIVAVPLLVVGAFLTGSMAIDVPDLDRPTIEADGFLLENGDTGEVALRMDPAVAGSYVIEVTAPTDAWEYSITMRFAGGPEDTTTGELAEAEAALYALEVPADATAVTVTVTWDDHLIEFGDPLLVKALDPWFDTESYLTHPTFFAAWVGILITGINLLPVGQLDGGHVARAVLGERMRWAGAASLALLMFLAFRFSSWILMALLLILIGIYHPPPLNDRTPLDGRRKAVAVFVLVMFAVCFVPVPIQT